MSPSTTDKGAGRARPFFCGNWKLFGTIAESVSLATGVAEATAAVADADVAVAPSFVALATIVERLRGSRLGVSAQDCHWEAKGAFTGEVSVQQIADAGARYVIVGHSERRQFFGETDETVARKTRAALQAGLTPIVCIGETLAERDGGKTLERVGSQFAGALGALEPAQLARLVIAYEPVWAIGTGRNATPEQALDVHRFIRGQLEARLASVASSDPGAAGAVRILYGGSVKPDNVAALMAQPDIDGALVGGASLTVDSFAKIVKEGTRACTGH
jgi:triosephosphate isomerase